MDWQQEVNSFWCFHYKIIFPMIFLKFIQPIIGGSFYMLLSFIQNPEFYSKKLVLYLRNLSTFFLMLPARNFESQWVSRKMSWWVLRPGGCKNYDFFISLWLCGILFSVNSSSFKILVPNKENIVLFHEERKAEIKLGIQS